MRRLLTVWLVALVVALPAASAQETVVVPDYSSWEKVAQRAQNALAAGRASDTALNGLRDELVGWRAEFLVAMDVNRARIATLRNQIEALGPAPEDGVAEPAELALRRAELNALQITLEAPARRAQEAHSLATGLVGQTDDLLRGRQAASLFELGPSPANLTNWPAAYRELFATFSAVRAEVQAAWGTDATQVRLRDNLLRTLSYLIISLVLVLRGRIWMVRLTGWAKLSSRAEKAGVVAFAVSLGQVVLPGIGLFAFAEALYSTELLGFRGQLVVDGLVPVGLAIFAARWLVLRLLPREAGIGGYFELAAGSAETVRRSAGGLALLWGLNRMLVQIAEFESYGDGSRVILQFLIVAIAGFVLFRLGLILRKVARPADGTDQSAPDLRHRAADLVGRGLLLVGLAGPLAALVGYIQVAAAVVFPSVLSLALVALVIVLTGVSRDLFAWGAGRSQAVVREGLFPIMAGFVLSLAALPFGALIWGARVADLSEVWATFRAGFQLGETRISPTDFLTFAVVFVIGYMITRASQAALKSSVLPKTSLDIGGQTAVVSGVGYVGIFLAAVIAISTAGIDLSSLAIVAGALSVGIGFGLQNIVSNFVSGVILLIERPIAEGDWIEVGGYSGTVREISVRSTRIETFDRTDVIIPNADLVSGAVTNYTRGNVIGRAVISVGVAYGSDTEKVQELLLDIAQANPLVSQVSEPSVHLIGFGADSLDFQIRAVLTDVNYILVAKSEIMHEIARRFAEEGIEIPFAQRDVWLRNPETLRGDPGGVVK